MLFGRVFDGDHVFALPAAETEFANGAGRICQEALPETCVCPGLGYDAGAIAWTDLDLIGFHNGVERRRVDVAFVDQYGFERPDT